jgi:hypothetical protein
VTSSSYEIGLLELQRFLIKEPLAPREKGGAYAIFDPGTKQQVGVARAAPGLPARFLRWFVPRTLLPTKLVVYETEDESLVFTVSRVVNLWRQRIEIYDADDHFMGYGENSIFSGRSGFRFYDRRGLPFANVEGEIQGRRFRFVSRDGRELGVVEPGVDAGSCLVSLHEELAEQPLAKMLLLGAALAIDLVYHGKDS